MSPEFDPKSYPASAVAMIGRDPWARVFTPDQWGDYLIYRLYPSTRVFVDGRSDFYGAEIGNQYLRLTGGQWDWEQIMQKYGFTSVLLPSELPICQLLKRDPGWRVEEDSGKTILLVRR